MSTGCECWFIEWEPGRWFYILEHMNAPKNAWDWREHATAWGPFATEEEASAHLRLYHANPGGSSIDSYRPDRQSDEVLDRLIAEART